jgi:hypothetical protein
VADRVTPTVEDENGVRVMDFMVDRGELHTYRVNRAGDDPPVPAEGQALLRVDSFGFTTNNITYAVFGDMLSYWSFFPAEAPWGRIPVWGFADVVDANGTALAEGTRVYGYLPMSTYLVVTPTRVDERGFVDGAEHRAALPAAYNSYTRTDADPAYEPALEDQQNLLRPLFMTAFLIDDFLVDNGCFGASSIVLSSASSKTSIGTAFQLAEREGIEVIGLTSAGNRAFVEGLGIYDRVVAYGEVNTLPADAAVFVDMAGDGEVRAAVHRHYGDQLTHSSAVGGTHWDAPAADLGGEPLPGPTPAFFFAPDQIRKRSQEWGQAEVDARFGAAWKRYVEWTDSWLEVNHGEGPDDIARVYLEMLEGRSDPATGQILRP